MRKRFRYPEGVRPLLIEETARRRRVESRVVDTLEGAGYAEIILPVLDYADPYDGIGERASARREYRFVDRQGELVAIRSDFTPMVARALAPSRRAGDPPSRVFYRGDVVRFDESTLTGSGELFQIGAEIIGDGSIESDLEAMQLAARALMEFGVRPIVIYSDSGITRRLVALAGEGARSALRQKRPELMPGGDAPLRLLVERMIAGMATLDDLSVVAPKETERLRILAERLGDPARYEVHLDDIDAATSYYTGLRFRIYGDDRRKVLAQGGRYDELYGRFGEPAPAVGFTFTIEDLD